MQKIRIDFDNPGLPQHISAVENDSQSRFFQATLYENGKAYTAPEGAAYSIMYRGFGPQNQGWYDTINDGAGKRTACNVSGNVVTCEIARQALQVPGHVSIVLCVTTGKGYMLKSWPIECDCKNDRYDSTVEIESFFYITQVSNADWTQAIQAWENLKDAIDPTLSVEGKAADAKATGDAVDQLKEDFVYKLAEIEISKHSGADQGYLNKNGVVISHVRYMTTDYIECVPNTTIKYKLYAIEEISSIISFYDANKKNISNVTIKGDGGSVALADGETEVPYNAAYFKYTYSVDSDNQKISYKKYYILKEAIKSNEDAINVLNDKVKSLDVINSQWQGKKWIAFGTSITDDKYVNQETHEVTGKYTKYLAELSGLILNNQGIAGGTIGSGGAHGGSSDILNRILSTDVSDADLITIEGFVNDFACAVNLGKPGDTENTSIIGALYQAVNYLQSNSHALVVLLTETTGRVYTFTGPVNTGSTVNYCYYTKKESSGLYQSDYNAAIKRFAEWAGCVCIDCGTKSEINCNNPQYLIDHLHHTELGGKQYAQAVWNELKNLHPLKK